MVWSLGSLSLFFFFLEGPPKIYCRYTLALGHAFEREREFPPKKCYDDDGGYIEGVRVRYNRCMGVFVCCMCGCVESFGMFIFFNDF